MYCLPYLQKMFRYTLSHHSHLAFALFRLHPLLGLEVTKGHSKHPCSFKGM